MKAPAVVTTLLRVLRVGTLATLLLALASASFLVFGDTGAPAIDASICSHRSPAV